MSDDINDWPYSDWGSQAIPRMRIADLLKDQGWDDDVNTEYGTDDDDLDEYDLDDDQGFRDRCECKLVHMFTAADELVDFLSADSARFPRTEESLNSFAAFGGWATGSWSMYVDPLSSIVVSPNDGGLIHLFGCTKKGHSCQVLMTPDGDVAIRAEKPDLSEYRKPQTISDADTQDDDDLAKAREMRDEKLYDQRTYKELDETPETSEMDEDQDLISEWTESLAPRAEVAEFIGNGLEIEQINQLARYMPRSEVIEWVLTFKEQSEIALEFLKIGLGELSTKVEFEDLSIDELRSKISASIRVAISEVVQEFEADLRVSADEEDDDDNLDEFDDDDFPFDPDDDPYLDE